MSRSSGSAAGGLGSATTLPAKEAGLFKKILKCYEQKQYKMLLKHAKQILSNPACSEHGETLAMKGLTLNCLGKKEEAYECVKRGLKNALQSPVCWHVYGLLQRSDHKYDEAIKCYRNALKWNKDKDNIQILRDLSLLQIQMRDLEGYKETRYQLFRLRPGQRVQWIAYAMAFHLLNDYQTASEILTEFRKTDNSSQQRTGKQTIDYENSELILYQVMIFTEGRHYQRALDFLLEFESEICDRLAFLEAKLDLLLKLERRQEAIQVIEDWLLPRNSDNRAYYEKLEQAMQIEDDEQQKHELYVKLQEKYPRALLPLRRPLSFCTQPDQFALLLDTYMRKAFRKGRPLFGDLKSLYKDKFKTEIIEQLTQKYLTNLLKQSSFDDDEKSAGSEDPCIIIWVRYFLSQHYSYFGRQEQALEEVDKALLHTPTLIELYVLRGKILKRQGKLDEAVTCLDEAQSLDTADRYLNTKCAKYMLRANMIEDAEQMCSKFTRDGMDAAENLNEMQCMWYQTEAASAYYRLGKIGEALKKCVEIERHFAEMQEDQFDFHTYCMRKMTLRAYVALLRLEDVLKSHPFYFTAAKLAIQIYLELYDRPLPEYTVDEAAMTSKCQPIENGLSKKSRKEKNKLLKSNAAEVEKPANKMNDAKKDKEESMASTLHKEPLISKDLERPKSPLAEAERFLKPLQTLARDRLDTHLLSFELYVRKNKPLLMLQSLKRAFQLDPKNSKLQQQFKKFCSFFASQRSSLSEHVVQVIDQALIALEQLANNNQSNSLPPLTDQQLEDRFNKFSLRT